MSDAKNKIVLVIGGARSGKSDYAQQVAIRIGGKVLFCATAEPLDDEMKARIEAHKKSRPPDWDTLEATRHLGDTLDESGCIYNTVVIDCITLLIANCLGDTQINADPETAAREEIGRLINTIVRRQSSYILVTNEVGNGLVPDNKLGRTYRDALGRANQMLAKCADEVYMMVAGLPVKIK